MHPSQELIQRHKISEQTKIILEGRTYIEEHQLYPIQQCLTAKREIQQRKPRKPRDSRMWIGFSWLRVSSGNRIPCVYKTHSVYFSP
jgi:hypothetical protein